jgi:hypothetical protein
VQKLKYFPAIFLLFVLCTAAFSAIAQRDTGKLSIEDIILRQKGIIRGIAQNLLADTSIPVEPGVSRTDKKFEGYDGKIIRYIIVQTSEFGFAVSDTTNKLKNTLRSLSNAFHHKTRDYVIRNNLFFSEHEKLLPFVLADNERHLRDLPFIRDASIRVLPVRGSKDSVDVIVFSKDVLTIGGSFRMHSSESVSFAIKEENLFGNGDRIVVQSLFDINRRQKFGYGFEYVRRNIAGSFIDGTFGFTNVAKTYNQGKREEQIAYFRLIKPLVSRNTKWTYGSELEWHRTQNFYNVDSIYKYDLKYTYNIVDAWSTFNIDAAKLDNTIDKARIRKLLGLRVVQQNFIDKPLRYTNQYSYSYADFKAVLASIFIFRQIFYKTQFIYGFGRNEDVPEGMEASFTSGWTKKSGRVRPYAGVNFQRYHFTKKQHYFNYSAGAGTYLYKGRMEDIDVLAKLDYFSRLYHPDGKWKQRIFLSTSVAKQFNFLLNAPLMPERDFMSGKIINNTLGGNTRFAAKAETVFFSPWSVLFFRFAPFVFGNAAYINWDKESNILLPKLNMALGSGIRIRNESLIFGTTEFRGIYFPRRNFSNESRRVEVSTNIRFKYNQQFIKRPELVKVN